MSSEFIVKAIGVVKSELFGEPGTPVQPAYAQGTRGTIRIYPEYKEALRDLDDFERIWVIFMMNRAKPFKPIIKPYLDDKEHGLFATRSPSRPNPIGMSCVRLDRVEGDLIHISELDMLDGTPVVDIKPFVSKFDCWERQKSGWFDHVGEHSGKAVERFVR